MADLESRIHTQRRIIEGFQALRSATPNQDVIRQADSNIRDARRTIQFLEESLASLHRRASIDLSPGVMNQPSHSASALTTSSAASPNPDPDTSATASYLADEFSKRSPSDASVPPSAMFPIDSSAAYRTGAFSNGAVMAPGSDPAALTRVSTAARRNYTPLDLMKYDTPLTSAKVQRMISQLEYKLQLERQFKHGYDKIARLYQAEGDRRSQGDAMNQRTESAGKLVLIQQALKRYQQLDMRDDEEAQQENPYAARRAHKPQSGTLSIAIKGAKEVDHAAISSSTRSMRESYVSIKVEESERVRTPSSRSDAWNVSYELPLENTNEVELVIFDRVGTSAPVPVGLLWLRISDIIEQLRKIKAGQVGADGLPSASPSPMTPNSSDWVTADTMASMTSSLSPAQPTAQQAAKSGLEGWFTVEPRGAVYLQLGFTKQNVPKRSYDTGLGRHGAMRKRRDQVSVVNGHRFVPRQFYQVIRCALCGELLLNAAGSQCEDCNYRCHRKCAPKIVTKCIGTKSGASANDEVELKHRIPHRFEPFTNLGANWCCHCGTMLPLGRRASRKCSECDITCHADCVHLVPDFCGMSMEMANQMLSNIASIKKNRLSMSLTPPAATLPSMPAKTQGAPATHSIETSSPSLPTSRRTSLDNIFPALHALRLSPSHRSAAAPAPMTSAAPASTTAVPTSAPISIPTHQPSVSAGQATAPVSPSAAGVPPSKSWHDPTSLPPPPPLSSSAQANQPLPASPATEPRQPPAAHSQRSSMPSAGGLAPSAQTAPQQTIVTPPAPSSVPPSSMASSIATAAPPGALEFPASAQHNVSLDDFNFLAVLGKGNFGKVMLAEEKRTGALYAIKVLKKEFIIENDEIDSTRSEKRVFLTVAREQHPFLLNLHSCFQTETRVYFVMEYVSGGDLMLHIQREQFNLHRAKFYAAEVLLALQYFHKHGIIYRDLKLDNIMLTLDGHIKIADYGLCKENMWYGNTTSTFCGTPEFMAPEILLEQRYGRAVDWWAFGILLYEMLLGQAPFRGDDEDEIFDAILEDEPLYPIQMPRDSVSLLQRLLTRDPARRLGAGPNDAEDVKAHPFFRDINWDALIQKRITPPFCPTLRHASDTEWFDTEVRTDAQLLTHMASSPGKNLHSLPFTASFHPRTKPNSATSAGTCFDFGDHYRRPTY